MTDDREVDFEIIQTGVPNLDIILGGGVPVGSFNMIAGTPGTGKTILSQQMMFHNATPEHQALHFTVLGEPVAKLLRYQRRFSFFDAARVNTAVRYIDIGDVIRKEGLERGLEVIVSRVERHAPSIVVVDSVRAVRELARVESRYSLRSFTHDLAQVAVVWNTTSFMIGEYEEADIWSGPEFTMADGIIWMTMDSVDNSVVRKIQVVKSRGMEIVMGLHSFRIGRDGIYVYPRLGPSARGIEARPLEERARFGVPTLDRMMGGGVPSGETCLVAGASGTGKSVLAHHFIAEGVRQGEACVALTFEETPQEYMSRARTFGIDFAAWEREGKLALIHRQPMDLTIDEIIDAARKSLQELGAKRLVIDSISGLELARSPADRSNFRESLYRMVGLFKSLGTTVLMTTEVSEVFGELRFSTHDVSFVADNIVLLLYTEIESQLRRALTVVKMRGSEHAKELRQYQITDKGLVVGAPFRSYTGVLSGTPTMVAIMGPQPFAPGLEARESAVVHALFGLGISTADQLAAEIGWSEPAVERILSDLLSRGYVAREKTDGEITYHVSMVTWAPGVKRAGPERPRHGGGQGSVE